MQAVWLCLKVKAVQTLALGVTGGAFVPESTAPAAMTVWTPALACQQNERLPPAAALWNPHTQAAPGKPKQFIRQPEHNLLLL